MSADAPGPGPDAAPGETPAPGRTGDEVLRRTVVVTGASAGLGYFAAEQLASAGHRVVLATRDAERAAAAERSIRLHVDDADLAHVRLDLADLDSVRTAAGELARIEPDGVDAILNNAGVVGSSRLRRTTQGAELQMGTNHLGHFAWTAWTLPLLERRAGRIVHLGSIAHRWARLEPDDPLGAGRYSSHRQYGRSKLAVMLFGFELAQRLADAGSSVSSVVAHPGFALEALSPDRPEVAWSRPDPAWTRTRPWTRTPRKPWTRARARTAQRPYAQGKDAGAEPLVHAAAAEDVRSGEYWGPAGWMQLRGPAAVVAAEPKAHDRGEAARLWAASEHAAGVAFALDAFA